MMVRVTLDMCEVNILILGFVTAKLYCRVSELRQFVY